MQITYRMLMTRLLAGAAGLALVAGAAHAQATGGATTGTGATGTQQTTGTQAPGTAGTAATGTMTDTTTVGMMMQEEDVKSLLEENDYSEVENLEQRDRGWSANAQRDGEEVEVRVQRATALVGGNLDEDMVSTMLEAEGFDNVSNVEQDGEDWTAEARHEGEDVKLRVISDHSAVISERRS